MVEAKLDDLETCKICLEPYDSAKKNKIPRTLACTHVLCTECIAKLIRKDETRLKVIACPFMSCDHMTDCSKGLPK